MHLFGKRPITVVPQRPLSVDRGTTRQTRPDARLTLGPRRGRVRPPYAAGVRRPSRSASPVGRRGGVALRTRALCAERAGVCGAGASLGRIAVGRRDRRRARRRAPRGAPAPGADADWSGAGTSSRPRRRPPGRPSPRLRHRRLPAGVRSAIAGSGCELAAVVPIGLPESYAERLTELVGQSSQQRDPSPRLTVCLVDDYLRPELAVAAAASLEGDGWLLAVRPVGRWLWFGPWLHGPASQPGWTLLGERMRMNRAADVAALERGAELPAVRPRSLGADGRACGLSIAARLVGALQAGSPPPQLIDGLLTYDTVEATLAHHAVARIAPPRTDDPPAFGRVDDTHPAAPGTDPVLGRRRPPHLSPGRNARPPTAVDQPDHRNHLRPPARARPRRDARIRRRPSAVAAGHPRRGQSARAQGRRDGQGLSRRSGADQLRRRGDRAVLGRLLRRRAPTPGAPGGDRRDRAGAGGAAPVQRCAIRHPRACRRAGGRLGAGALRCRAGDRLDPGQLPDQRRDALGTGRLLLTTVMGPREPTATGASRTASRTPTAARRATRSRKQSCRDCSS